MIMSSLAKVEMSCFSESLAANYPTDENAMMFSKGGHYGRKGHYQDESKRIKAIVHNS